MDDQTNAPAEYPKMLYKGGQPYGDNGRGVPHQDTITVANAEEQAEAEADGFAAYTPPGPEVEPEGEETTAGESTEAGEPTSGADSVAGDAGADSVAG